MKKILFALSLSLFLLSTACDDKKDEELWNDLRVGNEVYHFKQIEFRQDSLVVCTGMPHGVLTWHLSLDDGTQITRLFMLQQAEGWHCTLDASKGSVLVDLEGSERHDGTYRGIDGTMDIRRREFKTVIEMHDLRIVREPLPTDTFDVSDGYFTFDLTLF